MRSIKQLVVYLKPYWIYVILGPLLMFLEVAMDLMQPRLLETIVDVGVAHKNMPVIFQTGGWMVLCALFGAFGGIGCTIVAVRAAMGFSADLRSVLFKKIQTLSFSNLDEFDTGQLITRLTNDVTQLGNIVMMMLRIMVRSPLTMLGSLVLAFITSPRLGILLLLLMPVLVAILAWSLKHAYPMFTAVQAKLDHLNSTIQEHLSGVRVVKAFVRAQHEEERFNVANNNYRDSNISALQFMSIVMPLMMLVMNVGLVAALWYGGIQISLGFLQAGQLIAFTNYLLRALSSLMMFAMLLVQLSRAQASGDRVVEVLNSQASIQDRPEARTEFSAQGLVVFENVSFGFEGSDEDALCDISFRAEPGKTVAILGATGSGKSTLIHLIPRFYDVRAGRITLDGVDIRDIRQDILRRHMGIALQDVILFSGTIRDNIRYGRPAASEEEVLAAAKAAQAHDFITSFPDGYDTQLGQRGVNLSGGQKQRISIARALLTRPAVLILDDSTSSVDAETESRIQTALLEIMKDRTSFVIAQRISTVLTADLILVLDQGRLVAQGSHTELLSTCSIYQDIFASQLGRPEALKGIRQNPSAGDTAPTGRTPTFSEV
jgi:ATP-binding cassette, subfamily B, multidrug efflux pump